MRLLKQRLLHFLPFDLSMNVGSPADADQNPMARRVPEAEIRDLS